MARRRLHGETQKRRKKKQTRALKYQESFRRIESTQQPAPFERKNELNEQDIDFLEAMKEMKVKKIPRPSDAPLRMEKFEKVSSAVAQQENERFLEAMESLRVKPLSPGKASVAKVTHQPEISENTGRRLTKLETAEGKKSGRPTDEQENIAKAPREMPPETHQSDTGPTQFRLSEEDGQTMESLLNKGGFQPDEKYDAPASTRRKTGKGIFTGTGDPDSELDLHGKTLEEALGMVNNFILTSHRQKLRNVLIITGKGLNSGQQGPVLNNAVNHWLEKNGGARINQYGPAPRDHGGAGAIWVEMK